MKARTLVTAILLVVFLIQPLSEVVEANPFFTYDLTHSALRLYSPNSGYIPFPSYSHPIVYKKPSFNISFDYLVPTNFTQVDSFTYQIDDNPTCPLSTTVNDGLRVEYSVFKTIDNLNDGIYNLKLYALFVNGTNSQILNSYVKIDLSPPLDPLLPLYVALIVLVILSLTTALFFSRNLFKKNKIS